MSINGITNPLLAGLGSIARPDVARTNTERTQTNGTQPNGAGALNGAKPALRTQTPITGQGATQGAVPAEAPAVLNVPEVTAVGLAGTPLEPASQLVSVEVLLKHSSTDNL